LASIGTSIKVVLPKIKIRPYWTVRCSDFTPEVDGRTSYINEGPEEEVEVAMGVPAEFFLNEFPECYKHSSRSQKSQIIQ